MQKAKITKVQSYLRKPTTQGFLKAAQQLVVILEDGKLEEKDFFQKIHQGLVDLYSAGHQLEEISFSIPYNRNVKWLKRQRWYGLYEHKYASLASKYLKDYYYLEVFNPICSYDEDGVFHPKVPDDSVGPASLIDDIGDIYDDLKSELEFIKIFNTNMSTGIALESLKWGFTLHWGNHCIDALRCLHYLFARRDLKER